MKKKIQFTFLLFAAATFFNLACRKETNSKVLQEEKKIQQNDPTSESFRLKHPQSPAFDLNVILHGIGKHSENDENDNDKNSEEGRGNPSGYIEFRQDPDPAKIINLDVSVKHLIPNHQYLLQRAVDAINVVDGNCTSTSWLTLGKGLVPQSILTDRHGNGSAALWRDVTAVPSGSAFDIHFQVIDAVSLAVVLTSDCYQYTVR